MIKDRLLEEVAGPTENLNIQVGDRHSLITCTLQQPLLIMEVNFGRSGEKWMRFAPPYMYTGPRSFFYSHN